LSSQRDPEVVHESVLFSHRKSNLYEATFEDEEEDIIRINIAAPMEAYYYDENGTEKVEIKETNPELHRPQKEDGEEEVYRLSREDIIADADEFRGKE
jgi:hypothetical protein